MGHFFVKIDNGYETQFPMFDKESSDVGMSAAM